MRLLTMLATAVLLAACVHDTDDFNLFLAENGASLTYYIGSDGDGGQKTHDDPWNTIKEKLGQETAHAGKSDEEDPWDTINSNFGHDAVHPSKSGEEDPWDRINLLFPTESVHIGKAEEEDPWNRINDLFSIESGYADKSDEEDPWNRIGELFPNESTYTGKAEEEDPWTRILELFPMESVHSGKTDSCHFFGIEKSEVVFLSFSYRMPTTFRARVTEIRGRVLKLEFIDGVVQYVIDAPASWSEGTQLETGFVDAATKKDRPFLGVRFWRTVQGSGWGSRSGNPVAELPVAWPQEYQASGASLLVGLSVGHKSHDDPWTQINALFAKGGEEHDDPWTRITELLAKSGEEHNDPWNSIRSSFSVETVHTGKNAADPWDTILEGLNEEGKNQGEHDDPWTRIAEKKASFCGRPISSMVFVSFVGAGAKADDSWDRISENFSPEAGKSTVFLKLMEAQGDIGRFELADGRSLFAVGVPAGWEFGLVLRGEAFLLESKKMLPLMGAVVWEVVRNPLPKPLPQRGGA